MATVTATRQESVCSNVRQVDAETAAMVLGMFSMRSRGRIVSADAPLIDEPAGCDFSSTVARRAARIRDAWTDEEREQRQSTSLVFSQIGPRRKRKGGAL